MDISDVYQEAKRIVIKKGFADEIEWQREQHFGEFTETTFLREAAWVILCSGFKESIIRNKFDYISLCFCDWESAKEIIKNSEVCVQTAMFEFGNKQKLKAIIGVAELMNLVGFENLKQIIIKNPIEELQKLPFIGSITSWHLAKNLGLSVAKPDRHLIKLTEFLGYADVQKLCRDVADSVGDPISVVDIIFWRYCTFTPLKNSIV
ncbi:MAG: hypothetical protein ACAH12_00200 [Methylophilaceae bacterium]